MSAEGEHPVGQPPATEPEDACQVDPSFDRGGVPWFLLLLYLAFLVFFTWYVLDNQLPAFLTGKAAEPERTEAPR